MKILAIDPGTIESGYVVLDSDTMDVLEKGVCTNDELFNITWFLMMDVVLIEMFASYGMPVGKSSFDTVVLIGKLMQYFETKKPILITRRSVKMIICGSARAKDSNVNQAVRDLYPPIGGGSKPEIGTKSQPGKLYGVKSHIWAALALGIAFVKGADHYHLSI